MQEYIENKGQIIEFTLIRKKIKNINIRINITEQVIVSAPKNMPIEKIKAFVIKKAKWIISKKEMYKKAAIKKEKLTFNEDEELYILGKPYRIKLNVAKQNEIIVKEEYIKISIKEKYIENKEYIKKYYIKWLKEFAIEIYKKIVIFYQKEMAKYNIPMPEIEVKQMKSKWGSCIPSKRKITLNLSLIKTPIDCIEYVIIHELSHFKYQNHSKKFYDFISIYMPDWKEKRNVLNKEYIAIV